MNVVGSTELRPRIGDYLDRVRNGEDLVVAVHGHPAALLRALRPGDEGMLVSSRLLRDELHDVIRKARGKALLVTWHGRIYAVLEAPPENLRVLEDAS